MEKSKKKFLKQYLFQQSKIIRLQQMIKMHPERKNLYLKQIKECEETRILIEETISTVDDELLKEVLTLKYLCGKTLEETALIINYSKRHTERLHSKALAKLDI